MQRRPPPRWPFAAVVAAVLGLAPVVTPAAEPPALDAPVGGANAPQPTPPPDLVIETAELDCGDFTVRVPTGRYENPRGAENYTVPGPVVAFKGPDGAWRGHGYLETYHPLIRFAAEPLDGGAGYVLSYAFEGGKSYVARVSVEDDAVMIRERSDLGPRDVYVFDCYDGWQPGAAFVTDTAAEHHAFLYLPCHYDKAEATIARGTAPDAGDAAEDDDAAADAGRREPGGVAVLSADPAARDIAGFWCVDPEGWEGADTMGAQLWQRRQRPGDPASRHFLGPETKSDGTPNPHTANRLGASLYEGHVTVEFVLGQGTRQLGFTVTAKPDDKAATPDAFKARQRASR